MNARRGDKDMRTPADGGAAAGPGHPAQSIKIAAKCADEVCGMLGIRRFDKCVSDPISEILGVCHRSDINNQEMKSSVGVQTQDKGM